MQAHHHGLVLGLFCPHISSEITVEMILCNYSQQCEMGKIPRFIIIAIPWLEFKTPSGAASKISRRCMHSRKQFIRMCLFYQSVTLVKHVKASEQAPESTSPEKKNHKWISSWRHISCHTNKNRCCTWIYQLLPLRVRCPWQCAMPVQRARASEQARESTSPEKNKCDKQVSSWRHISCHTDKNRYYTWS